jgi:lipopolysaccharide/colanic/teichoic acid biosynthesis glycosyltransferase
LFDLTPCLEAILVPIQINLRLADPEPVSPPVEAPAPQRLRRERPAVPRGVHRGTPHHGWYLPCKHALDFAAALLLAVPALPLVVFAALAVKLTSRGPAFYTQTRVGKGGRPFTILKLRTMVHKCESLTGPRWSMPGDPRVTPVGWFLRVSHLDELPQLLNVLRGDMSLIGPRPERPEFVPELERALPAYRQRLALRPGVTGLAQVQLPPDSDLNSVRRKLAHDLYYIQHVSPWLDLRLLVCTGFYALGIPFRVLSKVLRIPTSEKVERAVPVAVTEYGFPRGRATA